MIKAERRKAGNLFRIALYFATGILNLEIAARALQLLPMMLIGLTAGIWTVKKVSPDWIRRAVILALIVSGAALIINNIYNLDLLKMI